jgi:NAD(P)H-dependent FMN reductase
MSKPVLQILIASTRPGRVGLPVGEWFYERAVAKDLFDVELIDLAEVNLPFMDEPNHPRLQRYVHEHTQKWSETIQRADAFVFVTPEYNHGFNAVLKNALDYLHNEWLFKPVGFVSYGGVAGGTRALQMLKLVVTALKMVPVMEAVNIPYVARLLDGEGNLQPDDVIDKAADVMLGELARLAAAFEGVRVPASA